MTLQNCIYATATRTSGVYENVLSGTVGACRVTGPFDERHIGGTGSFVLVVKRYQEFRASETVIARSPFEVNCGFDLEAC
jgi:hypothetical protein